MYIPPVFHEAATPDNSFLKPKSGGLVLLRRITPLTRRDAVYFRSGVYSPLGLGYGPEVVDGIRRARDLFERFREHRNAIAHFLVEGEQGQAHVYLADGLMIRTYSMGAVALLKYAHRTLRELRMFYTAHLEPVLMRGMVLPVPEQRDRYVVRENP